MEFIDGITLLNTIDSTNDNNGLIGFFIIGVISVSFIIELILSFYYDDFSYLISTFIGGMMISLIGSLIIAQVTTYFPSETYQVAIDDKVSFNDFNQHYKLLKQEGDIYTIEIKEIKNEKN